MNGMWKWLDRYMWWLPLWLLPAALAEVTVIKMFDPSASDGFFIVFFSVWLFCHCLLGLASCIQLYRKGTWGMIPLCLLLYGFFALFYFSVLWGPVNVLLLHC